MTDNETNLHTANYCSVVAVAAQCNTSRQGLTDNETNPGHVAYSTSTIVPYIWYMLIVSSLHMDLCTFAYLHYLTRNSLWASTLILGDRYFNTARWLAYTVTNFKFSNNRYTIYQCKYIRNAAYLTATIALICYNCKGPIYYRAKD